ncbi:hypothetical protein [Nocardia sp. NBC_01009]|nr:hypothetical protein OHA42_01460 [Nocardia sp. NBC_01009]
MTIGVGNCPIRRFRPPYFSGLIPSELGDAYGVERDSRSYRAFALLLS